MPKTEKFDDSQELLSLDVQFVSGVGTPATGEKFLLAKAKPVIEPDADDTNPEAVSDDDADDKPKKKKKQQGQAMSNEDPNDAVPAQNTTWSNTGKADKPEHYPWSQCVSDNKDADNPNAVCAAIARRSSLPNGVKGDKALKSYTGQDMVLPAGTNLALLTLEARKEVNMLQKMAETEVQPTEDSALQALGRRIAKAFGVIPQDESLAALHMKIDEVAKASGYAPADDAGSGAHPKYVTPAGGTTPGVTVSRIKGQAPNDDKEQPEGIGEGDSTILPNLSAHKAVGNNGAIGSTGVDGSKVTEQATINAGRTVTGTEPGTGITLGAPAPQAPVAPLTKEYNEFLARLEGQAVNKEAFEAAKAALSEAFSEPTPEVGMKEDEVRDLVMKGMDPLIDAIEALTAKVETLASGSEAVTKSEGRMDELESRLSELTEAVLGLQGTVTNKSVERVVRKSRVPAVQPVQKSNGDSVWEGSPFDMAAKIN